MKENRRLNELKKRSLEMERDDIMVFEQYLHSIVGKKSLQIESMDFEEEYIFDCLNKAYPDWLQKQRKLVEMENCLFEDSKVASEMAEELKRLKRQLRFVDPNQYKAKFDKYNVFIEEVRYEIDELKQEATYLT